MKRTRRVSCLLLVLLFGTAGLLGAEVLCQEPENAGDADCFYLLLAGITEEPDPITMSSTTPWSGGVPLADTAPHDESPQVVSANGLTVAVWVEATAGNGDIVFSEWRPDGWKQHVLTHRGSDERGPRVGIAGDGAVYVAWWESEETRRVRVVRRDPVSLEWKQPADFAAIYGSHPSVLVLDDEVLVAFERRSWTGGQQVVVHRAHQPGRSGWGGGVTEEVLASTRREAPLMIELHLHGERPFIDWIHGVNQIGYTEYSEGQWGVNLESRPLTQRHLAQLSEPFLLP